MVRRKRSVRALLEEKRNKARAKRSKLVEVSSFSSEEPAEKKLKLENEQPSAPSLTENVKMNNARKRCFWTQEVMLRAVESCRNGMTVRQAVRLYEVPRSTLADRVNGRVTHSAIGWPGRLLSKSEEMSLAHYYQDMASHGHPLTMAQCLAFGTSIRRKRHPNAKPLSRTWWRNFRRRHREELRMRPPDINDSGGAMSAGEIMDNWWIPQGSLKKTSNQNLCFTLRASSPASSGEDMKTEPVMDSTDYSGAELRSSLIKSEDIEESIERKNGYGMSREEKPILSNIKEEEEEGGERQGEEVKREDGVKDEEAEVFEWKREMKRDEWREGHEIIQTPQTDMGLNKEGIPHLNQQEGDGSSSLVTSCLLNQPRVPSPGSPIISSSKGQSEVFACSQCPFVHMEEVKLHQHIEKVHPEEHSRILRSGGNGAENPLPPSSTHQHPTPPKTLPTPTQSHTGTPGAHTCSHCGKSFRAKSRLTTHEKIHTGDCPYQCSAWEELPSIKLS
ncbi:hypothetical protein SKAU_G00076800 [Synaphobranchus kaupii]|uniref:C2H2-type domain-containing protein n=1 Tax=Synaphobranchus kaupii TaxID=118154 RepID=A0A9Q1JC87_SYNKA|nr:hypothetical protein SKAU_G00076800 [Synaphobranchus kaupii]